jgi:hypothetical protein
MLMINKLLCCVGWHRWTWKFKNVLTLDSDIPCHARCERCNKPYATFDEDEMVVEFDPDLEKHIQDNLREENK